MSKCGVVKVWGGMCGGGWSEKKGMRQDELKELRERWGCVLGDDSPDDGQFYIWAGMRAVEVIKHAILKCAGRNRAKPEPMDSDHRVRFVSSVLIHYDGRPVASETVARRRDVRDVAPGKAGA
jgi:hypothetical protein